MLTFLCDHPLLTSESTKRNIFSEDSKLENSASLFLSRFLLRKILIEYTEDLKSSWETFVMDKLRFYPQPLP